jgi:hypothetical protein
MQLADIQNPEPGPSPFRFARGTNFDLLTIRNVTISGPKGTTHISHGSLSQQHPPALILCLSTELSAATARAIDPKCRYCVRIADIYHLKQIIDAQLGAVGVARQVQYTDGDNRNTFLKSRCFSLQAEFRLAWEGVAHHDFWAELPPGMAERIDIPG